MNARKLLLLMLAMAAILVLAVVLGTTLSVPPDADTLYEEGTMPSKSEQLLDAVMDRIGVTRWSEALEWYDLEESGVLDGMGISEDTPVWVARNRRGKFHSVPICGGMKAPVRISLSEALAEERSPCPVCWDIGNEGEKMAQDPAACQNPFLPIDRA